MPFPEGLLARARNRLAAVQGFDPPHRAARVLGQRCVTGHQFPASRDSVAISVSVDVPCNLCLQ